MLSMYLKALEIQGFKSFPEKIRLSFEKSITAIVGPNGSGKSNISDAISWVMGEQSSKALRGSKMEDVIFGGAELRSQLGFAQVSLVIDNSAGIFNVDTPELMITRRYYRSGESEYFINKTSVRLKDINEMLMDTGLGRDGYSVIGQGKVDAILAAKSEDRREVFEEAAGISKIRYRKEESERKLLKTDENLLRINDKIAELELQIGPLKAQAETAKKYLVYRDELRGLEISLWMEALDKLRSQTTKIGVDYDFTSRQLDEQKRNLEALYEKTGEYSERIKDKDLEVEKIRVEISAIDAKNADCDNEIAVLKANLRNNQESMKQLNTELAERDIKDQNLKNQIALRRQKINEIEKAIAFITEQKSGILLENEEVSGHAGRREKEINELISASAVSESDAAAFAARCDAHRKSLAEIRQRSESNSAELKKAEERLRDEQELFLNRTNELSRLKEESESAQNRIKGQEIKTEGRRKRAAEINEACRKGQMEQNALSDRISLLNDMKRDYEGFSKAVRLVMEEKNKGTLKNIKGTVAELVKTSDRYTVAIETALGSSMQSIVVDREEDGKSAITMLKRRDGGRATFLPISAISGRTLDIRSLNDEKGVEGIAVKLVDYDHKYDGIFMNLLGRTLIVDTLDNAIRISRKHSGRLRMVTLDGQVINPGGSMTGGSAVGNAGILSRTNEIVRLQERLTSLNEENKKLNLKYLDAQRDLNSAAFELEAMNEEYRSLRDEILKLESEMAQRGILIESLKENCASYRAVDEEIKARIDSSMHEIAAAEEKMRLNMKNAEDLKAKAAGLTQGHEALHKKLSDIADRLSALRQEEASKNAEREANCEAMEELSRLSEDFMQEKERKNISMRSLMAKNEEIEAEISEKERLIYQIKAEANLEKERLSQTVGEKLELEAGRNKTEKLTQEKSKEIMELEREFSRLEQKKLAAELEEKQIVDKLWDIYELSRSAAQRIRQPLDSISKAQKRIADLKRDIAKLGTPNLGAIEEFERVNSRYTYLSEQRDDIQKAKTDLERIIREITGEMRTIFAREFQIVNQSFRETFTELFEGGRAELLLEDENDILNCGIEIKVQPPGKTLRTLSLLSGGERAFVAIALHFAILKVRPTPFCVLDEIETALDEKNVDRFAKYMRKMADKTQFLIITHRRGTMEEADVLYGVTMQHGISKVLYIDLEDALA
ncbi:MAG: chromosome segregation protein SMC [Clostridiales bacterium]|nr:chromosome segregation protein SMC [Clostridiales bacterium]